MKKMIELEWMKLFKQSKAKVLLILTWVSALVVSLGNLYFNSRAGFTMIDGDQMPLTMIAILGAALLPIVAYIMAVDFTSSDYKRGTIRFGMMAPVSRNQLYLSKLTALTLFNALALAGVLVIATVTNLFSMSDNLLLNMLMYIGAYLITLIPLTLVSLWGMLFGSYLSTGLSIAIGVIGVMALNVGQFFIPVLGSVSPTGYMNLSTQVLFGNTSASAIISVLLYLVAYYIILIALNLYRTATKEL